MREAWVGLVLPVHDAKPVSILTQGVLSGPRGCLATLSALVHGRFRRQTGYRVIAAEAVAILDMHHPSAAAWWREHKPHFLRQNRKFVFEAECCEPIPPSVAINDQIE